MSLEAGRTPWAGRRAAPAQRRPSGSLSPEARAQGRSRAVQLSALPLAASMNVALYAGIAGGLAAALILIGVGVYCCCCRGKDEAEDTKP